VSQHRAKRLLLLEGLGHVSVAPPTDGVGGCLLYYGAIQLRAIYNVDSNLGALAPFAPSLAVGQLNQKRIAAPLRANSGAGAVAGVHHRGIGQGQQLFFNAFEQSVVVAAWQVGAANAALEQHVAAH
jgi:hypothetical protein